ncbi:MAG: hypothetical protein QXW94_02205 [Desulfurococcaceae archaeon]
MKLSIETVLLFVVTICAAAAVAMWGMEYVGSTMTGAAEFYASVDQTRVDHAYVKVRNVGTVDISGVQVKLGGTELSVSYANGSSVGEGFILRAGEDVQLVVQRPGGSLGSPGDKLTFTVLCRFVDGKTAAKDLSAVVR